MYMDRCFQHVACCSKAPAKIPTPICLYRRHQRAFPFLVLNKCKWLAGLPQRPKSFSWDLRGSRKHQKVFRGTCGAPANTKKFLGRLAGLPQTPKSFSRDLRDSRKHQKVSRGTCGSSANTHDSVKMSVRWRLAFFLTQGAGRDPKDHHQLSNRSIHKQQIDRRPLWQNKKPRGTLV